MFTIFKYKYKCRQRCRETEILKHVCVWFSDYCKSCKHAVASRVNVSSTSVQSTKGVGFGSGTEAVRQKRKNIIFFFFTVLHVVRRLGF